MNDDALLQLLKICIYQRSQINSLAVQIQAIVEKSGIESEIIGDEHKSYMADHEVIGESINKVFAIIEGNLQNKVAENDA